LVRIILVSVVTFIVMSVLSRYLRIFLFHLSLRLESSRSRRDAKKERRNLFVHDPSTFPPTTKQEVVEAAHFVDQQTKHATVCVAQIEENLAKHSRDKDFVDRIAPLVRTFRRHEETASKAIELVEKYCSETRVQIPQSIGNPKIRELNSRLHAVLNSSGLNGNT
jgi:hypothetical protein